MTKNRSNSKYITVYLEDEVLYMCRLKGKLNTTEQNQGDELLQDAVPKAGRAGSF